MGQNSTKATDAMEEIAIRAMHHDQTSVWLEKIMKKSNYSMISHNEVEIHDEHDGIAGEIIKFIAREHINSFETYCGYGEVFSKDGIKNFQGNFQNGKRKGYGIEYNQNKEIVYEGLFKDNSHDGWGLTKNYQGQFSKGCKCGWGRYRSLQKNADQTPMIFYEGFWLNDQSNGFGALNVKEADIPAFLQNQKEVELGPYDQKYVGQWRHSKFQGIGKLVKIGEVYEGQFMDGLYEGKGVRRMNGVEQKGQFHLGKRIS